MARAEDFADLLDYPMYIVTAASGGNRAGCLVGFASQCSISPERYMVWLSKANHTFRVARSASFLGVHLLTPDQYELARLFGEETGDTVDKFAGVPWHGGIGGTPVLARIPAWFVGRVERHTDGGDHVGFLLSPVDGDARAARRGALLRLSDVLGLSPGHPAD
ncbi:flavin reductase family protein [Streptomyces sp. AK02-01A]|uniref:flavin reductase family protein n=1 Tax=Streptomyces sp. AK02-01A TaxID=3028648 RepID=UPI0039F6FBB6